jgi:hypothetical protein
VESFFLLRSRVAQVFLFLFVLLSHPPRTKGGGRKEEDGLRMCVCVCVCVCVEGGVKAGYESCLKEGETRGEREREDDKLIFTCSFSAYVCVP